MLIGLRRPHDHGLTKISGANLMRAIDRDGDGDLSKLEFLKLLVPSYMEEKEKETETVEEKKEQLDNDENVTSHAKKKRDSHPLNETELAEERNGLNLRSKEELVELLQQARRKISNSLLFEEEQVQKEEDAMDAAIKILQED